MLRVCIYTWDEEVKAPGTYQNLEWRRECYGYVSIPGMKKRMLRVCIYTWDKGKNALGMYLYLG